MATPPDERPIGRAGALARVVVWAALGGVAAALLELGLAWPQLATFFSTDGGVGRARVVLFLACFDGALAGACGLALGCMLLVLDWGTDLGPLTREAFGRPTSERQGARLAAYAVAVAAGMAFVGVGAQRVATLALTQFHHHGLIAAVIAAASVGLALAAVLLGFALAQALTPLLPFGRRLQLSDTAPAALHTVALLASLGLAAVGVALVCLRLQTRHVSLAQRALDIGLWAPSIVGGALVLGWMAVRVWSRRRPATVKSPARRAGWTALAALATLGLPLACVCIVEWSTVRQLDRRPLVAILGAVVVTVALAARGAASRFLPRARGAAIAMALALPIVALAVALALGGNERVRKATVGSTGLAPHLVSAVQRVFDFDRDGYSSVLGGGDCDDLDASIHPGAFDWPDDGIDQNCNGHDATLAGAKARPWAAVPDAVPRRPNVLLLTIDALRADHVGSYGYPRATTPNLDALAKESVRFARAYAHAPSTRYSVPAILTGRYPSTIPVGAANWPPNLLPENHLLAEMLREQGYATAAIHSYHYFSRGWGLDQGFDEYDLSLERLHSMGGDPSKTTGTSSRQLADADIAWLEGFLAKRGAAPKPFFLWSHYYDTHFGFERHPDLPESDFGPDELALYDGEIRFTDHHLGRVLAALRKSGEWDNTIIIVTSDHGDGFGEHGLPISQRHGYHLYTNETFVPLIIRVPGVAPRVVDIPAAHLDIVPTLLNALRRPVDAEPQLLGQSLLGLMLGETTPPPPVDDKLGRLVFQEVWYEGPTSRKAVLSSGWHYLANLVPDDTRELYDLTHDHAETRDLAGQGVAAEAALRGALGAWMDEISLPRDFAARTKGNIATTPLSVDGATALGDDLGDFVRLESIAVPPTAAPGTRLEATVVLRGRGRAPAGWRLFTHVVGADGRRLNADHEPVGGFFPLERLRDGTWLRDRFDINLPPTWPRGPTTIEIGAFRGGARAVVKGPHATATQSVRVATVTIQ